MWATVQDVKDRWLTGDLPATDVQVDTLIRDAEDIILGEFPALPNDVATGVLPEDRVVRVVSRMVQRVLRNPEGLRQFQDSTGPFAGGGTFGGDHPGELYLTNDDRRDLSGRRAGGRAFTVSTIPGGYR